MFSISSSAAGLRGSKSFAWAAIALWRWLSERWIPLSAGVLFAIYAIPFLTKAPVDGSVWQKTYVAAARRMQEREPIHILDEIHAYSYPPSMAMLAMPLALLPPKVSLAMWYLVNVAAMCVTVVTAWKLAGGPSLIGLSRKWTWVYLGALVLAGKHLIAPLENEQTDIVIAALLFSGCQLLGQRRSGWGGALLGLSAAMKCTPLLFLPYLAWRREWKALALFIAVAAGVNLLPDILWPQASGGSYLLDWKEKFLSGVAKAAPGEWAQSAPTMKRLSANQSLAGLWNRAIVYGFPGSYSELQKTEVVAASSPKLLIRLLTYGGATLLVAITVWRVATTECATPGNSDLRFAAQCSAILCLMLLVSPMTSKSHFIVLILPCFLLVRLALETRSPWLMITLAGLALTGPLTMKGIVSKPIGELFLFWGVPTLFPLIVLAAIWVLLAPTPSIFAPRGPDAAAPAR